MVRERCEVCHCFMPADSLVYVLVARSPRRSARVCEPCDRCGQTHHGLPWYHQDEDRRRSVQQVPRRHRHFGGCGLWLVAAVLFAVAFAAAFAIGGR